MLVYAAHCCVLCSCLLIVCLICLCTICSVPSVLWYCWLGLLTCKNRLPYNLYCVGGDVKHCTIQSNTGGYNGPQCHPIGSDTACRLDALATSMCVVVVMLLDGGGENEDGEQSTWSRDHRQPHCWRVWTTVRHCICYSCELYQRISSQIILCR